MAAHNDYYCYILFRRKPRVEPFYVGIGRGDRWLHHERGAKREKPYRDTNTRKRAIIQAILRDGLDVPKIKFATGLTKAEAAALEILLIATLGRSPNGPLVNLTDGGDGIEGKPKSASHRAAISAALKGKKHSPEQRERNAAGHRGKTLSDATKAKMSKIRKGKPKPEGFGEAVRKRQLGRKRPPFSAQWRRNQSIAHKASAKTAAQIERLAKINRGPRKRKRDNRQLELF
jgi:NUMOD3 motif